MADPSHSRLTAEVFVEMLHGEEDQAILSPNSESEIYDADDLDQDSSNLTLEVQSAAEFKSGLRNLAHSSRVYL